MSFFYLVLSSSHLECQFMQQRTGDVEPPIKDNELGPGLLHALAHARLSLLVSCQPLLQDLSKSLVHPTLPKFKLCSFVESALGNLYSRSISNGRELSECGAQRSKLLSHLLKHSSSTKNIEAYDALFYFNEN